MAVNKVIINGTDGETVLIDLTEDTVTPETLLEGVTAHDKSGEVIVGTATTTELPELTNPGTAENLLEGTQLIDGDGNVVEGAMANNGDWSETITPTMPFAWIPEGHHAGNGAIYADTESKTFTPTKSKQTYNATTKFVDGVTVNPIPDEYQDVSAVTATAEDVASGKVFVDATGAVVTGTAESGGASEYYTFVNNTGVDLCIFDCIVNAGETKNLPVLMEAFASNGVVFVTNSPYYTGTVPGNYIIATVDGVVPLVPKNKILTTNLLVGVSAYAYKIAGVDLNMNTSSSSIVVPDSGSTIVLTLSS